MNGGKTTGDFVLSVDRTCAGCGGTFHYRLRKFRTKKVCLAGPYPSAAAAGVEAPRADAVETHPCPHCGLIQPQMLAALQRVWFFVSLGVVALGIAAALFALSWEAVSQPLAAYVALASAAGAYLLARKAAAQQPNDDMAANLVLAQKEIAEGVLFPVDPGASTAAPSPAVRRPRPAGYDRGLWICLAAVVFAAAPVVVPIVMGWRVNPVGYPAVVGPGEKVSIPVPNSASSATAILKTSASAEAWNADEMKLPRGVLLKAEPYGASLPRFTSSLFQLVAATFLSNRLPSGATVILPADPALAGESLEIEASVRTHWEIGFVPNTLPHDSTDQATAIVRLSAAGAGANYVVVLYGGLIGALLMGAGGCGLLAAAAGEMKRSGVGKE